MAYNLFLCRWTTFPCWRCWFYILNNKAFLTNCLLVRLCSTSTVSEEFPPARHAKLHPPDQLSCTLWLHTLHKACNRSFPLWSMPGSLCTTPEGLHLMAAQTIMTRASPDQARQSEACTLQPHRQTLATHATRGVLSSLNAIVDHIKIPNVDFSADVTWRQR